MRVVSLSIVSITIPATYTAIDGCCPNADFDIRIMYTAGYSCGERIPHGVLVGVLKVIAWLVQNPGDEVVTVRNKQSRGQTGIIGTNDAAWSSGAIEMWRTYLDVL